MWPVNGASRPVSSLRRLICATAAAASGILTVTLTISEPACASSMDCAGVPAMSAVSVFVIDWTTTGAPPPTWIGPTWTPTVAWRFLFSITETNLPDRARHCLAYIDGLESAWGGRSVRTTLNLDDKALARAMKVAGAKTKTAVINEALRDYARRRGLRRLLKFEGKFRWEGDLDGLRKR